MFTRLLELAREGSTEKRRELFVAVSDLFVEGVDRYSDREVVLFGEVLGRLLEAAPIEDRIAVSRKVAPMSKTPRDFVLRLADDEAPVAEPVLERSPVLTVADLIELAGRKSDDHRVAIARRPVLPEVVTDILVDRGGPIVLETVTENQGARFSGRSQSLLAERAAASRRLAEAFARRTDFSPTLIDGVVRILTPAARRSLGERADVDGLVDDAVTTLAFARAEAQRQRMEARGFAADIQDGRRGIDEILSLLVGQRRVLDIACVLSVLAEVPESHVANAMQKPSGTAVAVICKHLDVSPAVYAELARLRGDRLCLSEDEIDLMLFEYRDMTPGTADRALKFHQKRNTSRYGRS
ncbi:DUF2336 domain-containing protein [Prosthecomicrobium sp. N25]|uniref:DUF2336 domain-containing protein n=1 Tax=Prosthecomicrobium sp. N25 TaxID=3129254 RepID=UPI00307737CE